MPPGRALPASPVREGDRMARSSRRRFARALVWFVVLAGLVLLLPWPDLSPPPRPEQGETLSGVVGRVYDGDTLEVAGVGKVRVLGIDALDGHNREKTQGQSRWYGLTTRQVEHWAEKATNVAAERLQNRRVILHLGRDRLDAHGRTLAYVHLSEEAGGQDFGLLMLARGLAATYRNAPHARQEQYLAAERRAQTAREGMWQDTRIRP